MDIGAGTGEKAAMLLRESPGAEVYAVDPNPKKIAEAQRAHPGVKSSVAGAEKLPFDDAFFDKAYSTMALHHFVDLDRALQEVVRVLKPGGTFVVMEIEPGSAAGRLFRLMAGLMGERVRMLTESQLEAELGSKSLRVLQTRRGSRYFVQAVRP